MYVCLYVCLCVCMHFVELCISVCISVCMYILCIVSTFSSSTDQPSPVANPARGQLNRDLGIFPCTRSRLRIWSRETGSAVLPRASPLIFDTRAESSIINHLYGAYSRNLSRFPQRRCPFIYTVNRRRVSTEFISGQAIAYRWRSLPRGRRRRASSPQGSSSNGCCLFRFPHGAVLMRLSFFIPITTGDMNGVSNTESIRSGRLLIVLQLFLLYTSTW